VSGVNITLRFEDLPRTLQSNGRQLSAASGELWLNDDRPCLVNLEDVLGTTTVWLKDLPEPPSYRYNISEIVYSWNSHWHQHPSEYIKLTST